MGPAPLGPRSSAVKALQLLLLALLAGCSAGTPPRPARWQDAPTRDALQALLCRLDPECRWLRLRLLDTDRPLAEIRYRFEIVLSRGMLERAATTAERAFVLAHELGHLRLGHAPPRNADERLPLELAADAWAVERLWAEGIDPAAGLGLLERLAAELERAEPPPAGHASALAEYARRRAALARQLEPRP